MKMMYPKKKESSWGSRLWVFAVKSPTTCTVTVLLLAMISMFSFRLASDLPNRGGTIVESIQQRENDSMVHHETFDIGDLRDGLTVSTSALWQMPHSKQQFRPRAILFVAHGCSHSSTDWFLDCPQNIKCIGLPEEVAIVQLAMERSLIVVAMSSKDRTSKCWKRDDGPIVAGVLKQLQKKWEIPILAFGASSGGSFVSQILPDYLHRNNFQGYICQIAAPPRHVKYDMRSVFISMNRDSLMDERIRTNIASKDRQDQILHIRLDPLPLDPDFFARRIPNQYTTRQSERMVQGLAPLLAPFTSDDGAQDDGVEMMFLESDPRTSTNEWKEIIGRLSFVNDSLIADQSPIAEVLNVAWGQHEMTRDGVAEGLDFLLQVTP